MFVCPPLCCFRFVVCLFRTQLFCFCLLNLLSGATLGSVHAVASSVVNVCGVTLPLPSICDVTVCVLRLRVVPCCRGFVLRAFAASSLASGAFAQLLSAKALFGERLRRHALLGERPQRDKAPCCPCLFVACP